MKIIVDPKKMEHLEKGADISDLLNFLLNAITKIKEFIMPNGDRTGPNGQGERTGRGAGYCAGNNKPGNTSRNNRRLNIPRFRKTSKDK